MQSRDAKQMGYARIAELSLRHVVHVGSPPQGQGSHYALLMGRELTVADALNQSVLQPFGERYDTTLRLGSGQLPTV